MTSYSSENSYKEVNQSAASQVQRNKFEGFDYLRAIFATAIVAIHADLFAVAQGIQVGTLPLSTFFDATVAYLGVPVFFQISLFLFYYKSVQSSSDYFLKKRLPKLISLYLFWVFSFLAFDILLNRNFENLPSLTSPRQIFEFVVSGGNTPLYFFFSLLFITTLAEAFIFLLRKIRKTTTQAVVTYAMLALSFVLLAIFAVLSQGSSAWVDSQPGLIRFLANFSKWDYNPFNFLPYIFITAIVVQELNTGKLDKLTSRIKKKIYVLAALFLTFTVIELGTLSDLFRYSRFSLVFGSWFLLYIALLSTRRVPQIVQFISGCSLGIYTFHLFFTHGFFAKDPNVLTSLSQIVPGLDLVVEFLIAMLGSIGLTLLFRRIHFLRNFV